MPVLVMANDIKKYRKNSYEIVNQTAGCCFFFSHCCCVPSSMSISLFFVNFKCFSFSRSPSSLLSNKRDFLGLNPSRAHTTYDANEKKFMSFHSIDPSSIPEKHNQGWRGKNVERGGVAIMSWARKCLSVVEPERRRWRQKKKKNKSPLHVASRTIAYDFDWLCIVKEAFLFAFNGWKSHRIKGRLWVMSVLHSEKLERKEWNYSLVGQDWRDFYCSPVRQKLNIF